MDARCDVVRARTGSRAAWRRDCSRFSRARSFRSANFTVEAPTREVAQRVAERAEECRTAIAKAWLGHELPAWSTPCPVRVRLTAGEAGGLTSFGFHQGRVTDQR